MTPGAFLRPAFAALIAASLSACGLASDAPDRFEQAAESVAAIPVDGVAASSAASVQPLKVEVMTPHALWDARDGMVAAAGAAREVAAESPQLVEAAVRQAVQQLPPVAPPIVNGLGVNSLGADTAIAPSRQPAERGLVQLGAYASEAAAMAAWERLAAGSAGWALQGLSPVLEPVEVEGRPLVRLKVRAPSGGAAAICAAAGIDDPWCRRDA